MADGRFEGRVSDHHGAARGLGRSHARLLAAGGAKVLLNDLGGDTHGGGGSSARWTGPSPIVKAGGDAAADGHDVVTDGKAIVDAALERWGRVTSSSTTPGSPAEGPSIRSPRMTTTA